MTADEESSPTSHGTGQTTRVLGSTTTTVGWVTLTCIVLAAVVALIPAPQDELLVILGKVRRPWSVSAQLLGVAFVASFLYSLGWMATQKDDAPAGRRTGRRIGITALTIIAIVLVGRATLLDGLVSTYHVLDPIGPNGCRVIVEERTFLLLGSGSVHALPRGALLTHEVDDFMADDGYRPVSLGTYSFRWEGDEAHLLLRGVTHAPVWPEVFTFRC